MNLSAENWQFILTIIYGSLEIRQLTVSGILIETLVNKKALPDVLPCGQINECIEQLPTHDDLIRLAYQNATEEQKTQLMAICLGNNKE